jgi:hypothetical protein
MRCAIIGAAVSSCLLLSVAVASAATVDAGFVVGPNNNVPGTYGGFRANGESSFNDNFSKIGSLENTPQAYNPLFGGSITTDRMIARDNSWLGEHDPASPFEDENGNVVWSFARITGDGVKLDDLRYERTFSGSSAIADELDTTGSYEGGGFEDSLSRSTIGIDYGGDGVLGGGDDTIYTSGNGTTPVDEIRVFADFGFAINASDFAPDLSGQAQLDATRSALDDEAPFDVTNEFSLVDANGDPGATGGSTVTVTAVPTPGAGAIAFALLGGMAGLRYLRRPRRDH